MISRRLSVLVFLFLASPSFAALPGDVCSVAGALQRDGGLTIVCDGANWQAVSDIENTGRIIFNSNAAAQAPVHVEGEVIIKDSGLVCAAAAEGAIRYNSSQKRHEYCDGSNWVLFRATFTDSAPPPEPPPGDGYFVMSAGTWDGNLGGIAGADAKCLADLQANNWMGKSGATVDAAHVKAFLCAHGSQCNDPMGDVRYNFAVSGQPTIGGAFFDANINGQGPGNTFTWSGTNYFGLGYTYWANRNDASTSLWNTLSSNPDPDTTDSDSARCQRFTSASVTDTGRVGESLQSTAGRWDFATHTCDTLHRLICMVHP